MVWYLFKTWEGREEELVKEIRRTVPPYLYHEAFVIYNERIWRHQGRSIIHSEPLFKGCVFVTCDKTEPFFRRLEQVPAMSRLMAVGDFTVFPLLVEDAEFLEQISGEDHVVRFSYVLKEDIDESVYRISGPLEKCLTDTDSIEFRKRFVKLRRKLWGKEAVIALGIVLNEDVEQGIVYENLKLSVELPEQYSIMAIEQDKEGKKTYALKGKIAMIPGVYQSLKEEMAGNGISKNYA